MRALWVASMLFATITVAQWIAAEISKSEALRADCVSMGVDSLTFFLNIFAEALQGNKAHRPVRLAVPLFSLSVLSLFSFECLMEAIGKLHSDEGSDEVDPWIVLAFAIFGVVFDIVALYNFLKARRSSSNTVGTNMMAALMHVGADFARSITTVAAGILIISFGWDGVVTDAWACIAVSSMILLGAVFALFEWMSDAYDCLRGIEE